MCQAQSTSPIVIHLVSIEFYVIATIFPFRTLKTVSQQGCYQLKNSELAHRSTDIPTEVCLTLKA